MVKDTIGGAKGDVVTNEEPAVRIDEDVTEHMEPIVKVFIKAMTDVDVEPINGELNDSGAMEGDVVMEETIARDVIAEDDEATSKETNELANIIGGVIFVIAEETTIEMEAEKDVEVVGDTTEGVTNAEEMEEEIVP